MTPLLWLVTGAALLVAIVALSQARRAQRRLEQLSQMYWELKYQQGEFRVQLQRAGDSAAGNGAAGGGAAPAAPTPRPDPPPIDGFVPLTSIRR